MTIQSAYQTELQQLERVCVELDEQIERLQAKERYAGDDFTEQVLEAARDSVRQSLATASAEPYFGRLDFREAGTDEAAALYIGKHGIENKSTGQPLVIDWRAPVASMFYSFTGGLDAASYDAPDGVIEGLVYLKRNLVIRKRLLQRVVDTYDRSGDQVAVNDEFLLYRLGENKDNRLRDIVSTIQAEQDKIIRAGKNAALVIQGVAGSGKTTVALHRLAFLLYQYRETVRANRMIIFAPNRMFLDYISGVLPELGVGDIQQTTFADWALDLLEQEVKLADASDASARWFAVGPDRPRIDDQTPGRLKGSAAFMKALREALERHEAGFLPGSSFEAWDGAVLPADTIREWFYKENVHYPLGKRVERVEARIRRWIEMTLGDVGDPNRRKDYRKKAMQRLKTYLKTWTIHSPLSFYAQLFAPNAPPAYLRELAASIPGDVASATHKLLRKKQALPEDLAPLAFIRTWLYGISGERRFDHIVIDEAQDFSPFQVALLGQFAKNDSFTILGDLSQGIHAYQGIIDWREFLDLFGEHRSAYFQLERSYRSTMEIIGFANRVLSSSGEPSVALAVPVFRSGEKVRVIRTAPDRLADDAADAIRRLTEGGAATVAVMTRTGEAAERMHGALGAAGLSATLIDAKRRDYRGGVSVLPVYLSKGLEFDAALLVDVDAVHYTTAPEDAKLLYVACTRALHDLWLFHTGEPSPLIVGAEADAAVYEDALSIR